MISDDDFDAVAQKAHMLGGALAVLGPAALFHHTALAAIVGGVAVLAFAAVKEFWWDERYETPEVRGSSGRDFVFYAIGVFSAEALFLIFG